MFLAIRRSFPSLLHRSVRARVLVALHCVASVACAQMTGGVSSDSETPHEVKVNELQAQMLTGDVDLFTGRYSASHPLGTVSTPGGLNFALALQYSPTIAGSATPALVEGVPYGAGWDVNVPTITVSNAYRHHYTEQEEKDTLKPCAPPCDVFATLSGVDATMDDGAGYWYAPMLNIPGVASGRAVFQRVDRSEAIFVLNTFERYVELRYDGTVWTTYTSDGKVYVFGPAEVNVRMPSNQRTPDYNRMNGYVAAEDPDGAIPQYAQQHIRNSIMPKQVTYSWRCTTIADPLHLPGQFIRFEYDGFGAFDFYKELGQDNYNLWLYNEFFSLGDDDSAYYNFATPLNSLARVSAHRDLVLKRVVATSTEGDMARLDLEYAVKGEGTMQMLNTGDSLDAMYGKELVWGQGGEEDMEGWVRFRHMKSSGLPLPPADLSPSDPYVTVGGKRYSTGLAAGEDLSFDHGVLESPRILPWNNFFPGDIYEVRTQVYNASNAATDIGNLDINVFTGTGTPIVGATSGTGTVEDEDYRNTREKEVFSTFDRAVKWNTNGVLGNTLETSNFFLMPDLSGGPTVMHHDTIIKAYTGLTIQIGPANSDNDFSLGPKENECLNAQDEITWVDSSEVYRISAYRTYIHQKWLRKYDGAEENVNGDPFIGVLSHHPLPHSFGIGLPWSMLLLPAHHVANTSVYFGRPEENPMFSFWWNDATCLGMTHANKPTLFPSTVKLKRAELWRYGKRAYLLKEVKSYARNGEINGPASTGMRLVGRTIVEHEAQIKTVYRNVEYFPGDTLLPSIYRKNVLVLTAIRQAPVDPSNDPPADLSAAPTSSMPSTTFSYDTAYSYVRHVPIGYDCGEAPAIVGTVNWNLLDYTWAGSPLLSGIVDPLGRITTIDYNDPTDPDLTETQNFNMKLEMAVDPMDVCESWLAIRDGSITMSPTVKRVLRSDAVSDTARITDYGYEDKVYRPTRKSPNLHYRETRNEKDEREYGYLTVTVTGPQNGNDGGDPIRNRTVHHFHGGQFLDLDEVDLGEYGVRRLFNNGIWPADTSSDGKEFLLFGKLKYSDQYDHDDRLLIHDANTYSVSKAFDNGMLRHHWDVGRFMQSHDYVDYDTAFTARPLQRAEPEYLRHALRPYPDNACLETAMFAFPSSGNWARYRFTYPGIYLNSYFVALIRSEHTEHDPEGCVNEEPFVAPSWPGDIDTLQNAGGGDHVNTTVDPNSTLRQNALGTSGLSTTVKNDLVSVPALDEAVLSKTIKMTQPADVERMREVLAHQPGLTITRWSQLLQKGDTVPNSVLRGILEAQPYLSDGTLGLLMASTRPRLIVKDMLLRQEHLSSAILEDLLKGEGGLGGQDLLDVLLAQGRLPRPILVQLMDDTLLTDMMKATVLVDQEHLSDAVLDSLEERINDWDPNAVKEIALHGPDYPDDDLLLAIINASPAWPDELVAAILEASPKALGPSVLLALNSHSGIKGHVHAPDQWTDLVTDCGALCESEDLAISVFTDYSYYTADSAGVTDAPGYKRLFGYSTDHEPFQLKWQPSWLLFSKRTFSPQYPSAYTTDEYYYYQDLKNRYDRHWTELVHVPHFQVDIHEDTDTITGLPIIEVTWDGDDDNTDYDVPAIEAIRRLDEFGHRAPEAYQHRIISKNAIDTVPLVRNEFRYYFGQWPRLPYPTNDDPLLPEGDPCPTDSVMTGSGGTGSSDGTGPFVSAVYHTYAFNDDNWLDLLGNVPVDYALTKRIGGGYYFVPFTLSENIEDGDSLWTVLYRPWDPHRAYDPGRGGDREDIPELGLKRAFQLRSSHRQADSLLTSDYIAARMFGEEDVPLMQFTPADDGTPEDEAGLWQPVMPYATLDEGVVLERNAFQQPQLSRNERGLLTRYVYARKNYSWYHNPVTPCHNYQTETLFHPGLPSAIITGAGRGDSLVSYYRYRVDNSVDSIIDPNGMVLSYGYDEFGRLARSYRNGNLLGAQQYAHWSNTSAYQADPFNVRAQADHVTSVSYLEAGEDAALVTRAYVDPLGRGYNTVAWAYDVPDPNSLGQVPFMVSSGRTEYDGWDRPVKSYKPYVVGDGITPFDLKVTDAVLTGTPALYTTAAAERDPRGRPLTETKVGETVGSGGHWVKHRYQFLDEGSFACSLGLSAGEAYQLMPSHLSSLVWRMEETTDEDGNRSRTYTNALGQQVATQGFINDSTTAVTLFFFDSQGQITRVSDPEKHNTRYAFNLLGWMYAKETADGGTTRYMYDRSGNVVLEQDAEARKGEYVRSEEDSVLLRTYRRYTYDPFNRLVQQDRSRKVSKDMEDEFKVGNVFKQFTSACVDPLEYAEIAEGFELDEHGEEVILNTSNYARYHFTSASTLDWLSQQGVLDQNDDRSVLPPAKLITAPIPEKKWYYVDDKGHHLPAGMALHPNVWPYLLNDQEHVNGRPSVGISYPHKQYRELRAYNDEEWENPVLPYLYDIFSYNAEGLPGWHIQQFNPLGIEPDVPGLLALTDNARYDLRGNLRTVNVDINADHMLDLQQHYTYDAWGRLVDVYASHDGSGAGGEHMASLGYDTALALLDYTNYYRLCKEGSADLLVDSLFYIHDDRDRLTVTGGRYYSERLYYDEDVPQHATGLKSGRYWNGLINGAVHSYRWISMEPQPVTMPDIIGQTLYGFSYDGPGRLTGADCIVTQEVAGLADPDNPHYAIGDERYTFDRIGNLRTLGRHGWFEGGPAPLSIMEQAWAYAYGPGNSHLVHAEGIGASVLGDRDYTYNSTGDMLTDDHRQLGRTVIGRSHLPWSLSRRVKAILGREDNSYLYDLSDRRIRKLMIVDKAVDEVETDEWHLFDDSGRELGLLDLTAGTWEWYLFGAQRFARLQPDSGQQPAFYSGNIVGHRYGAVQLTDEYQGFVDCILGAEAFGGITYPLTIVRVVLDDGPKTVLFLTEEAWEALQGYDPAVSDVQEWVFDDEDDEVSVDHGDAGALTVSIAMILGDALYSGQVNSNGLWYIHPEQTKLDRVTYFEHDHLGDLRVAFTPVPSCTDGDPMIMDLEESTFTIEHVLDYYPYGKVLRQYVNASGPERYLTTQHERDQETGLDYRGARYYDSDVARFLSLDPLAADYASWSAYNYVMGNPISLVDPTGRYVTKYEDENGKYLGDDGVDNGITMQVSEAKWNEVNSNKANLTNGKLNTAGQARLALGGKITDSPEMRALKAQQQNDPTNRVVKAGVMAIGALAADDATGVGAVDDVLIPIIVLAEDIYMITNMVNQMSGRAANKRTPDPEAKGDHTVIDGNGSTTYTRNERNPTGWDEQKRVDTKGRSHRNPDGTEVPTPHVKEAGTKGVRPACKGMDY